MSFKANVADYINAGYSALYVTTHEERRVCDSIINQFKDDSIKRKVYEWDSALGLTEKSNGTARVVKDTEEPVAMFDHIRKLCNDSGDSTLYLVKDFHLQFEKPLKRIDYIRAFKNTLPFLKPRGSIIVFISPVVKIPTEVTKEIQMVDYALPNGEAITAKLDYVKTVANKELAKQKKAELKLTTDIGESAVEAAKGMTDAEIENAFSLALVKCKEFNPEFVKIVFSEKIQQVKKSGLLTYIPTDINFENVGGLNGVKEWIVMRKNAFSKKARDYGLPFPKGIGIAGVPGCGKTLISKAISSELNSPLFQLDLGRLFSKYVGETEQNFAEMIKTVESIGRCVLHIDEVEKYLNTGAVSGQGDSGTSSRSFGTLLSWLSDRDTPSFIVCTSNNHLVLPPELTRKGRFDEWFWVDLPDKEERKSVIEVVIKKYGRNIRNFDVEAIADATTEFSGSEIDNAFKDAMFKAFSKDEEVNQKHLMAEISKVTPQSKIHSEKITEMRAKVEGRLRRATIVEDENKIAPSGRKIRT